MVTPFFRSAALIANSPDLPGLSDLASIRIAYIFELGSRKKVAVSPVADFSHPA
jgi:hypothetical protein